MHHAIETKRLGRTRKPRLLSLVAHPVGRAEIAYGFVQQFVTLLKERNAQPLDAWLLDCQLSGISDLATFAQGLEKEGLALQAAFTLPYSNDHVA